MRKHMLVCCLVSISFGAIACGEKKEAPSMQPVPAAPEAKPSEPAPAAQPAPAANAEPLKPGDDGVVHLIGTDQMRFNSTKIEAKAGKLKIELKNTGALPKEVMGHDLVVLKPGLSAMEFAQKAMTAKATEYIPTDGADQMLAHTKLLGPGEAETIELDLQPGTYPFLCTFPGHVGLMNGTIVVQ